MASEMNEEYIAQTTIPSNESSFENSPDFHTAEMHEKNTAQEAVLPEPNLVDTLSAFDLRIQQGRDDDNDSAKAGLESTHDLLAAVDLDSAINTTRERHVAELAGLLGRIEQATRDQDKEMEVIFRRRIDSLGKIIQDGDEERNRLTQLIQQKDLEIGALRLEMALEIELYQQQLDQQKRLAQEDKTRAEEQLKQLGLEHEQDKSRAEEQLKRLGQEHEETKARAEEELRKLSQEHEEDKSRAEEQLRKLNQEHEEAMATLRADMTKESEQRVSHLLEELGQEAEQRVNKVRAEMDRMKAEFEREQEQTMKEMKSEMARLAKREREARESLRRAETVPRGDEYRQPVQAWAIARLWGVGQARAR